MSSSFLRMLTSHLTDRSIFMELLTHWLQTTGIFDTFVIIFELGHIYLRTAPTLVFSSCLRSLYSMHSFWISVVFLSLTSLFYFCPFYNAYNPHHSLSRSLQFFHFATSICISHAHCIGHSTRHLHQYSKEPHYVQSLTYLQPHPLLATYHIRYGSFKLNSAFHFFLSWLHQSVSSFGLSLLTAATSSPTCASLCSILCPHYTDIAISFHSRPIRLQSTSPCIASLISFKWGWPYLHLSAAFVYLTYIQVSYTFITHQIVESLPFWYLPFDPASNSTW